MALVLVWVSVILFAFADTIMIVLFGQAYASSGSYTRVMSPLALIMGILPIFTFTLLAIGKPWRAVVGLGLQSTALGIALLVVGNNLTPSGLSVALLLSGAAGTFVQWLLTSRALGTAALARANLLFLAAGILAAPALRLGASITGTSVSPWHFAWGGGFTVLYALALTMTGHLKLRPHDSST